MQSSLCLPTPQKPPCSVYSINVSPTFAQSLTISHLDNFNHYLPPSVTPNSSLCLPSALFHLSGIILGGQLVGWLGSLIFQVLSYLSPTENASVAHHDVQNKGQSCLQDMVHNLAPATSLIYGGSPCLMLEPSCATFSCLHAFADVLLCLECPCLSRQTSEAQGIAWYFQTDLCAFSIPPLNFKTNFFIVFAVIFSFLSTRETVSS